MIFKTIILFLFLQKKKNLQKKEVLFYTSQRQVFALFALRVRYAATS